MLNKPRLIFVGSTPHTITLKSKLENALEGFIYTIKIKEKTYGWTIKYWGLKRHYVIKDLAPQEVYCFKLGVCPSLDEENVWSDLLYAATKRAPLRLFHLFNAAESGDVQGLRNFFNQRKDFVINAYDKTGETALIKGVKNGHLSVCSYLISVGASVNYGAYGSGRTPLMNAAYNGYLDIADLLIENGADCNAVDRCHCQPLHYAVENSKFEMVKYLLSTGSNINAKDSGGWTPLTRGVALHSSPDIIKELHIRSNFCTKDKNGNM